jgi:hypothetical protein
LIKLEKLSDEDVLVWSNAISVKAVFYEFIDNEILIAVPSLPSSPIFINNNDGSDFTFRTIFESVMKELDNKRDLERVTYRITVPSTSSSMIVNGTNPSEIILSSTVRRIVKTVTVDEVLGYINPQDGNGPVSTVHKHSQGVEIIETGDRVSIALSLGAANSFVPPNCFFHTLFFDLLREREVSHMYLKGINISETMGSDIKISIIFRWYTLDVMAILNTK